MTLSSRRRLNYFTLRSKWLHERFRILTLDELISQLQAGTAWREPLGFLTFDDAYKDNFDTAVPILAILDVPATFFIPTAFLEAPRLPWWDHVAYVVKRTTVRQLVLQTSPESMAASLHVKLDPAQQAGAIMVIIQAFLNGSVTDERWFLNQLDEQARVTVDSQALAQGAVHVL